jgi:alpha-glucosidase
MFGNDILVAPIAESMDPGYRLSRRPVWLPEGEWIEWFTGAHLKGPAHFERSFTLNEIPAYVKTGTIIPMQPKMNRSNEKPVDPLILKVFPGASGSTRLYEDAGNSLGYKQDEFAWTEITYANSGGNSTIEIAQAEGSYPGMPLERGYEIQLVQTFPPEKVTANGQSVPYSSDTNAAPAWHYDGATLTTVITLPSFDVHARVKVAVQVGAEQAANASLLAGAAGRFVRLRRAMDIINSEAYPQWSPDSLIEAVQTSRRIELNPASALDELRRFWANQEQVINDITALETHRSVKDRALAQIAGATKREKAGAAAAQ